MQGMQLACHQKNICAINNLSSNQDVTLRPVDRPRRPPQTQW